MSGTPEHIKVHRELEYLRAAGTKGKRKKKSKEQKQREKERYKKLREVNYDD